MGFRNVHRGSGYLFFLFANCYQRRVLAICVINDGTSVTVFSICVAAISHQWRVFSICVSATLHEWRVFSIRNAATSQQWRVFSICVAAISTLVTCKNASHITDAIKMTRLFHFTNDPLDASLISFSSIVKTLSRYSLSSNRFQYSLSSNRSQLTYVWSFPI